MANPTAPNPDDLAILKRYGLDSVAGAFAFSGGEELSKPGLGVRRRARLNLADGAGRPVQWYLKCYGAAPWPKRLWRWLCGQGGVSPARREFENIARLAAAGVPTMRGIAFGQGRDWLGATRSYLIVSAVPGDALERCGEEFFRRHAEQPAVLEEFTRRLTELVSALHNSAGLVHRDLYAAHIFLDQAPDGPRLHLIDLARVFEPHRRKFRWWVKDLAALKYSMPAAWVEQYWDAFLAGYLLGNPSDRDPHILRYYNRAIDRRIARMRRRAERQEREH